jgi:hypothetical protein
LKKNFSIALVCLACSALLTHNFVPHTHHNEEMEHHEGHEHDHHKSNQNEGGLLNLLFAEAFHPPGSGEFYLSHTTSPLFKFSAPEFFIQVSEIRVPPPPVVQVTHPPACQEERILSFSVVNASLRAPPVA